MSFLFNISCYMCCWWVCVDRYVILGGHRDAWVFGGIDPMSGAAVVHETVRSAGRLLSTGMIFPVSEWNNYCINTQDSLTSVCVCRLEAKEDYNICQLGCRGVWTAGIYRMGRGTVYANVHTLYLKHTELSHFTLLVRIMPGFCRRELWPTSMQTLQ